MDRATFEHALTQMLETFQRCGVSRFGAQPLETLPAAMQSAVAELIAAQSSGTQSSGTQASDNQSNNSQAVRSASPSAIATTATRPVAGGETLRSTQPASVAGVAANPSQAADSKRPPATSRTGELIPMIGLAAQPWSLPVLPGPQRQESLELLAGKVRECRLCSAIVSYRQQTVFGAGSLSPRICFVGEAPGADEDRSGQPFVGPAGQLLTKIIAAMKLSRDEVYILNALKCRPPQNRTPLNEEIESCRPFVERQLDLLQPEFIVCLGAVAVRSILQSELPIGRLRGQFHRYRGARVVVTYHPSYLLRNESAKRMVWDDMKMLMAEL